MRHHWCSQNVASSGSTATQASYVPRTRGTKAESRSRTRRPRRNLARLAPARAGACRPLFRQLTRCDFIQSLRVTRAGLWQYVDRQHDGELRTDPLLVRLAGPDTLNTDPPGSFRSSHTELRAHLTCARRRRPRRSRGIAASFGSDSAGEAGRRASRQRSARDCQGPQDTRRR